MTNPSSTERVSAAEALCADLKAQGYLDARVLADGSVAALQSLLTTTALFLGVNRYGYDTRYCFRSGQLARVRFEQVQSEDDVPEGWHARRPDKPEDVEAKRRPGYLGGDPMLASSWEEGTPPLAGPRPGEVMAAGWGKTEGSATRGQWVPVDPQPDGELRFAEAGTIWVCGACGKTARDRYDGPRGWDESCFIRAVLCHDKADA